MRVAICYSGQLRNMRMMIDSHINCLYIPLIENNIIIDVYMFSDNNNTTRKNIDGIKWTVSDIDKNLFKYFANKIINYANNIKIRVDDSYKYDGNNYNSNILSQLNKFYNVLKMIESKDYDYVIRLRPDIYFDSKLDLNKLDKNTIYQNRENLHNNYEGDSIQIFRMEYLNKILDNTYNTINELNTKKYVGVYEYILNKIFTDSGLKLEWIDNFGYRWYDNYAKYFENINLNYFEDWINAEYKFNFSIDKLRNLLQVRKSNNNILIFDQNDYNYNIEKNDPNRLLYLSALNPDFYINYEQETDIIYKDIVGLIPCSGTASRMNGIPKFLLPCKEGNLIDNTINLFKVNNIDNIYVSILLSNENYIKNKDNIKYIVKNTNTMSETVRHLINIKSKKYILIMPDTYFINNENNKFNEITKMNIMLNKFDVVLIIWKIKDYQYGKLGQVNIQDNKISDIMDKNLDCKYPYSWGIIGWTNKVNHLIDENTPHIGYLINSALKNNIDIGYIISDTEYFDCGTNDEYFKMINYQTNH